jgi:hypothetical protein
MSARSRLCGLVCVGLALGGCASNIVLTRPPEIDTGTFGPTKRCEVDNAVCRDDEVLDTSRAQASGASYFRLPDCPHGIHDIIVQDAKVVLVRCAAPKQQDGLPVTAANGGSRF